MREQEPPGEPNTYRSERVDLRPMFDTLGNYLGTGRRDGRRQAASNHLRLLPGWHAIRP